MMQPSADCIHAAPQMYACIHSPTPPHPTPPTEVILVFDRSTTVASASAWQAAGKVVLSCEPTHDAELLGTDASNAQVLTPSSDHGSWTDLI
jgi:hypothetical protein